MKGIFIRKNNLNTLENKDKYIWNNAYLIQNYG
jgi:hypothetical protein